MSAGNGTAHDVTARLPSFANMSSVQRSASMDATVQRVAELSAHHNQMAAYIARQGETIATLTARIESADRHMAHFTGQSFLARLRWILFGR